MEGVPPCWFACGRARGRVRRGSACASPDRTASRSARRGCAASAASFVRHRGRGAGADLSGARRGRGVRARFLGSRRRRRAPLATTTGPRARPGRDCAQSRPAPRAARLDGCRRPGGRAPLERPTSRRRRTRSGAQRCDHGPTLRRGARTGAHWTSQRWRRVAGVGRIWLGGAGEASYRAARVGGRRGGAALGSTARQAGSLAVAAGRRARRTALSEAAHLGTVTLVPVAIERDRGRDADSDDSGSMPPVAESVASVGRASARDDDPEALTSERTAGASNVTEPLAWAAQPPRSPDGNPASHAGQPAPGPAKATEETVAASTSAAEPKVEADAPTVHTQPESADEASALRLDAEEPAGVASEPPRDATQRAGVANEPPREAKVRIDTGSEAALEPNDEADASSEPAFEATERADTSSQAAREASDRDDPRQQPKARTRKSNADRNQVEPEPSEPASQGNDSGAASGSPRRRKRSTRTPRTTTPQGERTPQQSR